MDILQMPFQLTYSMLSPSSTQIASLLVSSSKIPDWNTTMHVDNFLIPVRQQNPLCGSKKWIANADSDWIVQEGKGEKEVKSRDSVKE